MSDNKELIERLKKLSKYLYEVHFDWLHSENVDDAITAIQVAESEIERLKSERVELVKFTLKHFLSYPYCLGYSDSEITECIEQFNKEK